MIDETRDRTLSSIEDHALVEPHLIVILNEREPTAKSSWNIKPYILVLVVLFHPSVGLVRRDDFTNVFDDDLVRFIGPASTDTEASVEGLDDFDSVTGWIARWLLNSGELTIRTHIPDAAVVRIAFVIHSTVDATFIASALQGFGNWQRAYT
jgi:hypothetical protein